MSTICYQESDPILERYFHEIPDKRLALFAFYTLLIVYAACLVITIWTKCWFMLLVPLTGFLVAIGFAYRASMISNPRISAFTAMQLLIIVPPLLLAAANYECLGKCLSKSIYWLPIIFIIVDVICLLIQIFGVTYLTKKTPQKINQGLNIMLVGLLLALLVNIAFVVIMVYFQKSTTTIISKEIWIAMYVTMGCLLVRNIYRFIEFVESKYGSGYLASHEIYMYILDFAMIFACIIILSVMHYGFYLQK